MSDYFYIVDRSVSVRWLILMRYLPVFVIFLFKKQLLPALSVVKSKLTRVLYEAAAALGVQTYDS